MTCVTVEMSRPRAATSVATRIGTRPPLNASITPSREPWVMSPCSARTFMPRSRSVRKSWSQRIFVRTNTIAWSGCSARSTSTSFSALSLRLDRELELRDGVDRERRRLDLDDQRVVHVAVGELADRRRHRRARTAPSGGSTGVSERIFSTSSRKPRSSISSASSSTTKRQSCSISEWREIEVEHAPDGADDDVPAGAQLRLLGADRRAAEDRDDVDAAVARRRCAAPA